MDTPDKNQTQKQNQICTPRSKFEDSPVFNYLKNLSPIPIKSSLITQPLTSLNIASLPSVFASPQVTSHRESRFLKRHESSDPSKSEFTSDGNRACGSEGSSAQQHDNSAELQGDFDLRISTGDGSAETPGKCANELSQTFKYVSGSPGFDPKSCSKNEMESVPDLAGASTSLVHIGHESSEKGPEGNLHLQEVCKLDKKNQGIYDWDPLTSDGGDLMMFNSPCDSETLRGLLRTPVDSGTSFMASVMSEYQLDNVEDVQKNVSVDVAGSGERHEAEEHLLQPQESAELQILEPTHENIARSNSYKCISGNVSENMVNELDSYTHRGIRRRCLDFEMIGGYKSLNKPSCSSVLQQNEEFTPKDKQLVPVRPGADSSSCNLPGIGLHLNVITTASMNYTNMNHEVLNSTSSISSDKADQESILESLTSTSSERGIDVVDNGGQLVQDASQACLAYNEVTPNSPKKKRRKADQEGEPGACKRCNCKKSKCLKLYCECFAAGVYCIEPCSCQDCFNKPIHESTVLATRKQIESRNPLAFAPKVIRSSEFASENRDDSNKTPASARHKRGCNCKKSSCLKKYCECYQGGVGCSINCRCESCKNTFGRKDGSASIGLEAETEMERETHDENVLDKSSQSINVNSEKQIPTTVLATPSQIHRPLVQLSFPSNNKPPRCTSFLIGSSYTSQKIGKPNILKPQAKFENQLETVPEDAMPDILCENHSPGKNLKTASPNSKRIAPPNCDLGSSPPRRSGRKLILQSIPSFPSLNSQQ